MPEEKKKGEMAVVYARYSSRGQQEQSIEGQLAAAKQYADKKGYTILRSYCDRAKTGTNDNREAFQQMLSDCAKHAFTVIIVWKVDRFGRNREEITFNKYRAKKQGVRVEYVAENISAGPEGVILESVLEGMAEYYSMQLSQNVKRGLLESAKKHHVIGGHIILGYQMGPNKEYQINPDTAPIVRMIFQSYADGHSMVDVTRMINEKGYRTPEGTPFTRNSLPRILKNEKYIGVYTFKDIIRDVDAIPAIVDKETFLKVQRMLKMNKRMPARSWAYADYILTGKLRCAKCGGQMVGKSGTGKAGTKYTYYVCLHKDKSCSMTPVRQDYIEELVLNEIRKILSDGDYLEYITEVVWKYYLEHDHIGEEKRALEGRLEGVEKSIVNLSKAIEAGILNEEITNRMQTLEKEKSEIKISLAEKDLNKDASLTRGGILYYLTKMKDKDIEDPEARRELIDTFVNVIYLDEDQMTIAFNYREPDGEDAQVTISGIKKAMSESVRTLRAKQGKRESNPH